ncbi:MAG: DPP IV N-terminal domain-containing protein [Planctomycetota bacterium]
MKLLAGFAAAMGVAGLTGCQQYTGAFGLRPHDKKQAVEYAQFKEDLAEQRAAGELAQQRFAGAQFGDAQAAPVGFDHTNGSGNNPTIAPVSNAPVPPIANTPHRGTMADLGLGRLGLFGDNAFRSSYAPRSPLDGFEDIHRITTTAEGADFDPAMHPDGGVIAYASTRHRRTSDIYAKKVGSSAVTQLTNDPANDMMPAFSPDGSKLAFASDRDGNWNIYLMDARGGRPVQITFDGSDDLHPDFSPDGTQLVYSSFNEQSQQWEIVLAKLSEPGSRQIIGQGLFPDWHPTEQTILYQKAREIDPRWFSVWSMDLIDGDPGPPTELAISANAACITPQWSSDGGHIVFSTVIAPHADGARRPNQADVWVMRADGTQRTRMTGGRFANLQPIWSPQGAIFFVSNRGPNGLDNIWAISPQKSLQLAADLSSLGDTAIADTGAQPGDPGEAMNEATAEVPTP